MKTTYLLLLSTTLTLSVGAEPSATAAEARSSTGSLSLGEVTSAVLANNPAIQQALKKWAAAKERVTQEAAWDDLKVSGSSRAARFVDVAPNSFTDQMASVEQIIPLTGKNLVRARIAAADAVEAFERARREQLDVLAKARASYFRLLNATAQLELNRRNLVSLREIAEVSRSRYEVGKANAAEPLVGEVEASKLLESQQDILRNISAEQSQLNVLMNRDAFAPLGRPDETNIKALNISMMQAREIALANRPEIKIAQARIDMEKSRLGLARRNWIPDPAIKVEAQRYNDSGQAASEVDLFQDKLVPQARQAFEANQFAYETGKATFLEWITAQRNLRDLEAMGQQHIADYYAALAELEAVVGADLKLFPSTKTKEAK